ncbi:MAG: hypothetical protein ACD_29C00263G0002 [uncultured bacterium]|nr:MAG: hypothetical protein ACD_29C00263G0002 [uncultured bacterium]
MGLELLSYSVALITGFTFASIAICVTFKGSMLAV